MNEYAVYFTQTAETTAIRVEAEDAAEAIDLALDKLPGSLCHQCARDVSLDGDWEPEAVEDADGNEVWTSK